MKKKVFLVFLKNLGITLLVLALVLGSGLVAYQLSYQHYYKKSMEEIMAEDELTEYEDILSQVEAKTDDISKNFIYVKDKNNNIRAMMVQICNTKTHNMDYVTVPIRTYYTIPSTLYQKLINITEEIPQVVRISRMRTYFPKDMADEKAFGYISIIMEKVLDTEKSYYTVISYKMYTERFKKQKVKIKYKDTKKLSDSDSEEATTTDTGETIETTESAKKSKTKKVRMAIHVANENYLNQLLDVYGDEEKTMDLLKSDYNTKGYVSNLNVFLKIGYVESYLKTDPNYFHYWGVPAKKGDKGYFSIKTAATKKMFKSLVKNDVTYETTQFDEAASGASVTLNEKFLTGGTVSDEDESEEVKESDTDKKSSDKKEKKSSKEKKIIVLNSTDTVGLAASWKETLESAGYDIGDVADYEGEGLTDTKIYVSEEGYGKDLKNFFENASVEVGEVREGYDIEIVLGESDSTIE